MRFCDIKVGQKFRFVKGYGGPNRPERLKKVIYEKIELTPPRDSKGVYFDFQSKNAKWVNGDQEGLLMFFCDEEKSFDCFEIVK